MRGFVALTAGVVLLAGCSGGASVSSTPPSASSVATKAGCSGWAATSGQLEMYVKQSGTCTLNGQEVNVDTFNDNAARDNYLKAAKSFGGTFGQGDLWVIHGDDSGAVGAAVKSAGGSLS